MVEHGIWSLPNKLAAAGNDLYSSLWAAIEGSMKATASAIRIDNQNGSSQQRQRCIRIYGPMFDYLSYNGKSPLKQSILKLRLKPERWMHIARWPFGFSVEDTEAFAKEARTMARAHGTLAKAEAMKSLDDRIEQSLNEGSGWLHKSRNK